MRRRKLRIDLVLECLKQFSDREVQETLWAGLVPGSQCDFHEATCQMFDDSGLGDALDKGETGYSSEIESRLRKLLLQIKKINGYRPLKEVLSDPAMQSVRNLAKEILNLMEK